MDPGPAARGERRVALALLLILATSLALRFWYLDWRLAGDRFWDERYSFENVARLLDSGSLEPANGYYPLLSYLPQAGLLGAAQALHRAAGSEWLAVRDGGGFNARAYLLARTVQALWGVAAVWLTFLVGRRLFSAAAGLVAAAALAFSPWMIHASGVFKPDAPLVAAVLLAFLGALDADRRPTAGRHAVAGAGVALAMSVKLTGGLAALPLVFVSLLRCRREPRRLALLALAGGVALVLFLLLNPHWPLYFDYLDKLTMEYRWKAEVQEMTRWRAPLLLGGFLARSLGALGAGAAAIAAALLAWRLVRRRIEPARTAGTAALLLFPPAWAVAYLAKTEQLKPNNFLPIVPFAALAAAWGLVAAGRWLAERLGGRVPAAWRPRLPTLGAALALAAFAPPGIVYVHRSLTPSAEDLALRFVGRRLHGHPNCQVIHERGPARWPPWELGGSFRTCHLRPVERLSELGLERLSLADGVLFPQHRLAGGQAAPYLEILAASHPERTAVFGRQGPARGPGFVAATFPWRRREPERQLILHRRSVGRFRLEADMPAEVAAGEVVSFTVWLPRGAGGEDLPSPRLRMGGQIVDLAPIASDRRGTTLISPRLVDRQPAPHVRLNRRRLDWPEGAVRVTLWRWLQGDPQG